MSHVSYHVAPRYSCGSPAMVPRETALRVAVDEKDAYERTLEGAYGEEAKLKAEREGLDGIVEEREIFNHHYIATDCLTGKQRDSRAKAKPPAREVPAEFKARWAEQACDSIDAGFFSGDTFHDAAAIDRMEWYMGRWQREIVRIRAALKEDSRI